MVARPLLATAALLALAACSRSTPASDPVVARVCADWGVVGPSLRGEAVAPPSGRMDAMVRDAGPLGLRRQSLEDAVSDLPGDSDPTRRGRDIAAIDSYCEGPGLG